MTKCVYIHIPFCKTKCKYCSFCSFNALKHKNKYINSLTKEIKFLYKKEYLETIYFGGGTPSLLDSKDLREILQNFNHDSKTEITIEINPNDFTQNYFNELINLNINRLSFGVQSFDDEILKEIGRSHTNKEIFSAIEILKKNNFENFSIDLMYGLPKQTLKNWHDTLDLALEINPAHISLYGLKIEEGTYFYKFPPKNLPNLDLQAKMYEIAIKKLKEKYIHYEFSNFAKEEKYFSKHNLAYWKRKEYYGFGLSASGFLNNKRYTNTFLLSDYLKNPLNKEYESLNIKQEIEEEIFLGLRLKEGINFKELHKKYKIDIFEEYKNLFEKYISYKLMEKTQNGIKLTEKGVLVSNEILCDFIDI